MAFTFIRPLFLSLILGCFACSAVAAPQAISGTALLPPPAKRLPISAYPRDRQDPKLAACWRRHVGANFDIKSTREQYKNYVLCARAVGIQPRSARKPKK